MRGLPHIHATPPWSALLLVLVAVSAPASAAQACQVLLSLPAQEVKAPVEGRVVQALQCRDAEGEHLFVETRLQPARQLQPNGKPHVAELTFYKFTNGPRGYAKRWQARDFVPLDDRLLASAGRNSRVSRANRFVISDVDGDGLAEAFMSYALPGHGQNPDEGKLLLFYKDRKYVIRGAVAAGPADFGSRTLDAGFSSLPQAVQSYALGLWDAVALPGHLAGRPLALTELSPR